MLWNSAFQWPQHPWGETSTATSDGQPEIPKGPPVIALGQHRLALESGRLERGGTSGVDQAFESGLKFWAATCSSIFSTFRGFMPKQRTQRLIRTARPPAQSIRTIYCPFCHLATRAGCHCCLHCGKDLAARRREKGIENGSCLIRPTAVPILLKTGSRWRSNRAL
jgi:hypothetical protein